MNDDEDNLIARYYYANCMVSFYKPDTMVVSRNLLPGHYDIIDPRKFKPDEDLVSRFFDFLDSEGRLPNPNELLYI